MAAWTCVTYALAATALITLVGARATSAACPCAANSAVIAAAAVAAAAMSACAACAKAAAAEGAAKRGSGALAVVIMTASFQMGCGTGRQQLMRLPSVVQAKEVRGRRPRWPAWERLLSIHWYWEARNVPGAHPLTAMVLHEACDL